MTQLRCENERLDRWFYGVFSGIMVSCVVILVLTFFGGCEGSKQAISRAASDVQRSAQSALVELDAAKALLVSTENGEVVEYIERATVHVQDIEKATITIQRELPGVKDVEAWYVTWFKRGILIAIGAVGLYFLMPFLPMILGWLIVKFPKLIGIIPRTIRAAAKFDAEALETVDPTSTLHESIAVRRTQSPLYEAAFKVAKKKQAEAKK